MDLELSNVMIVVLVAMAVWDMAWKGVALWRAAQKEQTGWFVALMVVNSVGILPIIYLLTSGAEDE